MVYLAAAVIMVPIAKKLGLGSVLGYLLAGIVIGPAMLGFIGKEGQDIMHFAEFGVVMMLFHHRAWNWNRNCCGNCANPLSAWAACRC